MRIAFVIAMVAALTACGDDKGGNPEGDGSPGSASPAATAPTSTDKLNCGYQFALADQSDREKFMKDLEGGWISTFPGFGTEKDPKTGEVQYVLGGYYFNAKEDKAGYTNWVYLSPDSRRRHIPLYAKDVQFQGTTMRVGKVNEAGEYKGYRLVEFVKGDNCMTMGMKVDGNDLKVTSTKSFYGSEGTKPDPFFIEGEKLGLANYERLR